MSDAEYEIDFLPKFSVIVTVFNQEKYLKRAVLSVLDQTLSEFELIVVDDGSTDGSADAIASISDKRMRVLHQENQGASCARNTGIKNAIAPWVAFLDGDDFWLSNHLEALKHASEECPAALILSTHFKEVHEEQLDAKSKSRKDFLKVPVDTFSYFSKALSGARHLWTCCIAVRRDVFEHLAGFGGFSIGEDTEMWVRIALNYPNTPVAVVRLVTSVYVRGTGGIMEAEAKSTADQVIPIALADLSPAFETISDFLQSHRVNDVPGLSRYINLRLCRGIRTSVVKGNRARAVSLTRMMLKPKSVFVWAHSLLAIVPKNLQIFSYKAYRRLKQS